MSQNIVIL